MTYTSQRNANTASFTTNTSRPTTNSAYFTPTPHESGPTRHILPGSAFGVAASGRDGGGEGWRDERKPGWEPRPVGIPHPSTSPFTPCGVDPFTLTPLYPYTFTPLYFCTLIPTHPYPPAEGRSSLSADGRCASEWTVRNLGSAFPGGGAGWPGSDGGLHG
jgi:hypothetical protein